MDLMEAVNSRKSIRGYKKDPVPREVLTEILRAAVCSPSAVNTQPWEFTVISGEVLDHMRRENIEKLTAGAEHNPDLPGEEYGGAYRQRQVDLAMQIFKIMDIKREDKAKRTEWLHRGFRYFDAPVAIILSMDKSITNTWAWFDLGCVAQTICLVALQHGLGTCIESQGVIYDDVVRKYTDIPESKTVVISIAIGYPDWEFAGNTVESEREPAENITTWHGF